MALNYYSPLRLIRGLAPGMRERGDGHIINISTWRVLQRVVTAVRRLQRVEGGTRAVSRVIDTEWATRACTRRPCTTRW